MPENVEIKARAGDWQAQFAAAARMADRREDLVQEDVFFHTPKDRLKLRIMGDAAESYLIYYSRPDASGPKTSSYMTAPAPDPQALRDVLGKACGEKNIVRKKRTVFFVGQTRVHFDDVEGLGKFLELEICLHPGQTQAEGEVVARDLMGRLSIAEGDLIQGAYADMAGVSEK